MLHCFFEFILANNYSSLSLLACTLIDCASKSSACPLPLFSSWYFVNCFLACLFLATDNKHPLLLVGLHLTLLHKMPNSSKKRLLHKQQSFLPASPLLETPIFFVIKAFFRIIIPFSKAHFQRNSLFGFGPYK